MNFYGDSTRWFVGVVVNATPPSGSEGKIKVRIQGIHSQSTGDVPESALPWCSVVLPTTEGGVSGLGRPPRIQAGARVFGIFLDGKDSQQPLVLGSIPGLTYPSQNQVASFLDGNEYDLYSTFANEIITTPLDSDILRTAPLNLRRSQAMKFFIDNGYSLLHAAALTGVLQLSNFTLYFDSENTTQGIAEWRITSTLGSRFTNLVYFSSSFLPSRSWKSFSVQLAFVLSELRSTHTVANGKLLKATTLEDACDALSKYYLPNKNRNGLIAAERAYEEVRNV